MRTGEVWWFSRRTRAGIEELVALSNILNGVLALLLPSTFLAGWCLLGAVLVLASRHTRYFGAVLLGAGVAGLAAVLLLPVDLWLLRPLENRFPAPSAPGHVDGIVVLGGAVSAAISADRGSPTLNRDADRLVVFAALARRYPDARLVFAGGPPARTADRPSEAEASRELLQRVGVTPGRMLVEDQSRTTWENAVDALAVGRPVPGETWLLITSASHMPRAVGAFRSAGWPPVVPWPVAYRTTRRGWPAPFQPVGTRLNGVDLAAHEWSGLIVYWLEGHTDAVLPRPDAR